MKRHYNVCCLCSLACALFAPMVHAAIAPGELVAPKMEILGGNLNFTVQPSVSGRNYWLQCSDTMAGGTWTDVGVVRSGDGTNLLISTPYVAGAQKRFYRVAIVEATPAPAGFSLISAGSFEMGQTDIARASPVHTVYVSGFYMGRTEVTWLDWRTVRDWAVTHRYTDLSGRGAGKADTHPVQTIAWYEMVKWCNAKSEMTGLNPCYREDMVSGPIYRTGSSAPVCNWSANGYRLPTEAEWEKSARGGLSGKLFPWGDTITHSQANYCSYSGPIYDVSPTRGYHPIWGTGSTPYTSPVENFAPNGYGLYDMAGNVYEWCWDWHGSYPYPSTSQTDPRGAVSGWSRVYRGGNWSHDADNCCVANRNDDGGPSYRSSNVGFRVARSSVP
jgi:formylglycine-generating enzyme required for sulfatase activity